MKPCSAIATARRGRGQSLVEFSLILPVLLILAFGMMEFGFAFSDKLTLGNATREGARIGSALVTGSEASCTGDPSGVDGTIVASVQNILRSGGSDVALSRIDEITIFRADVSGNPFSGDVNIWRYAPGSGPDVDPGPGTETLDFSPSSVGWPACDRDNDIRAPESLGVSIRYAYQPQTPLGNILAFVGGSASSSLPITDSTVMALNPTD